MDVVIESLSLEAKVEWRVTQWYVQSQKRRQQVLQTPPQKKAKAAAVVVGAAFQVKEAASASIINASAFVWFARTFIQMVFLLQAQWQKA